ncbi:MAG: hypothetical protein MJ124_09690 [Lachnospiraceae bacterium]|nr:hypothetical protein [Lachnospiraceae bacterium]
MTKIKKRLICVALLAAMIMVVLPSVPSTPVFAQVEDVGYDGGNNGNFLARFLTRIGLGSIVVNTKLNTEKTTSWSADATIAEMQRLWPDKYPPNKVGRNDAYMDLSNMFIEDYGVEIPDTLITKMRSSRSFSAAVNAWKVSNLTAWMFGLRGHINSLPSAYWDHVESEGLIDTVGDPMYGEPKLDVEAAARTTKNDPGWFEKNLSELLRDMATKLNSLVVNAGMSIETAIFGRVAGNGIVVGNGEDRVVIAPYTFELETGNPYGVVAGGIYSKVRTYAYLFIALLTFFQLACMVFQNGREGFEKFAVLLKNVFITLALIMFMPYLFELVQYIRDLVLHNILASKIANFSADGGIVSGFSQMALDSKSALDAILYLMAVVMQVAFCAIYIGMALEIMIYFISFPFICIKGVTDMGVFKEWGRNVLGLLIVPFFDGILYMLPCYFSGLSSQTASGSVGSKTYTWIALICMLMMMKARKVFFGVLGVNAGSLGDAAAALGGAGLALASGIVRNGGQIIKSGVDTAREVKGNMDKAKTYEALGKEHPSQFGEGGLSKISAPETGKASDPLKERGSTDEFANYKNWQDPDIARGLSFEKKAQLARETAIRTGIKGGLKTVGAVGAGTIGTITGGAIGAGLTMSPEGMAHGSMVGGSVGSATGAAAGSAVYYAGSGIYAKGPQIKNAAGNFVEAVEAQEYGFGNANGENNTCDTAYSQAANLSSKTASSGISRSGGLKFEKGGIFTPKDAVIIDSRAREKMKGTEFTTKAYDEAIKLEATNLLAHRTDAAYSYLSNVAEEASGVTELSLDDRLERDHYRTSAHEAALSYAKQIDAARAGRQVRAQIEIAKALGEDIQDIIKNYNPEANENLNIPIEHIAAVSMSSGSSRYSNPVSSEVIYT